MTTTAIIRSAIEEYGLALEKLIRAGNDEVRFDAAQLVFNEAYRRCQEVTKNIA